jgi:hypothetical protein
VTGAEMVPVEEQDVALAVLVLINDADLTSDEALDLLVEQGAISPAAKRTISSRYWRVSRQLRPTVERIRQGCL